MNRVAALAAALALAASAACSGDDKPACGPLAADLDEARTDQVRFDFALPPKADAAQAIAPAVEQMSRIAPQWQLGVSDKPGLFRITVAEPLEDDAKKEFSDALGAAVGSEPVDASAELFRFVLSGPAGTDLAFSRNTTRQALASALPQAQITGVTEGDGQFRTEFVVPDTGQKDIDLKPAAKEYAAALESDLCSVAVTATGDDAEGPLNKGRVPKKKAPPSAAPEKPAPKTGPKTGPGPAGPAAPGPAGPARPSSPGPAASAAPR